MPGSPNITQPVVLRALTALNTELGGWHTLTAIMDSVAAAGSTIPESSISRALRELAESGAILRRWDYPAHQRRRRAYCIARPVEQEPLPEGSS